MTADDVEHYRLSEAENRRIFQERIVPQQFSGRTPQRVPTVVVLLAQPGAGKTRLAHAVGNLLNERGGFIEIDSDLYKPYHPAYDELMRRDDTQMAKYTRADGRAWMALAHEYVRDHKLNAIIQETSQDAEAVAETIEAYRRAGARIEVLAMGVAEALSDQGIYNRYFEQVRERGSGRLTVMENAKQSLRGSLELARIVDARKLAEHAAVYRRGEAQPRYSNRLNEAGAWERPPDFAGGIETERNRPLTEHESWDFVAVQAKLRAGLKPEFQAELSRIDGLARPLLHPDVVEQQRVMQLGRSGFGTPAREATRQSPENTSAPTLGHESGREPSPEVER